MIRTGLVVVFVTATAAMPRPAGTHHDPAARATVIHDAQQGQTVLAQRGDIAAGVLSVRADSEVRVKTEPCKEHSTVVVFYAPFTQERIGQVKCGAQVFDRYQVEKQ